MGLDVSRGDTVTVKMRMGHRSGTSCVRPGTEITGGGMGKSFVFSVKSAVRNVADMMISFSGEAAPGSLACEGEARSRQG